MSTVLINVTDINTVERVLEFLKNKNKKLVLAVHYTKYESFCKKWDNENIVVIKAPAELPSAIERLVVFIARNSIPTHTVRQIQEEGMDGSGRLPFFRYVVAWIVWYLGRFKNFKRLLKFILPPFFNYSLFDEIFDTYKPDLVFAPTIFTAKDLRFLACAKKRGVKTVGVIKSWDNLTSKDSLLIHPDKLIVHNFIVKREAIDMYNYPEKDIFMSGVPKFDWYANLGNPIKRDDFFSNLKLDPNKKLITYFSMGSWLVVHERSIIEMLAKLIQSEVFKYPSQLLVRFHPAYRSEDMVVASLPGVIVDRPGTFSFSVNSWKADYSFGDYDRQHLIATLRWSDIAVNCGSTTAIESAIFNTPIVNFAFDGDVNEPSYWRKTERLIKREHYAHIVNSKGIAVAKNEDELINAINSYLDNSSLHSKSREKMVKEQCYKIDGKAGERIADFILKQLNYEK